MPVTPLDLALLIVRFQILLCQPSHISEAHGFGATITTEAVPIEVFGEIVELTQGRAGTQPSGHGSGSPDHREKRPD